MNGWLKGGLSFFSFGPVPCEKCSGCYCCSGLFYANSDLSHLHATVIHLCQHRGC